MKPNFSSRITHDNGVAKPIFMSECCSCNTMRSEDEGVETKTDNPHKVRR